MHTTSQLVTMYQTRGQIVLQLYLKSLILALLRKQTEFTYKSFDRRPLKVNVVLGEKKWRTLSV